MPSLSTEPRPFNTEPIDPYSGPPEIDHSYDEGPDWLEPAPWRPSPESIQAVMGDGSDEPGHYLDEVSDPDE